MSSFNEGMELVFIPNLSLNSKNYIILKSKFKLEYNVTGELNLERLS